MGTFEGVEGAKDATDTEIAQINAAIALLAERQIYARDDQFNYQMAHNEKEEAITSLTKNDAQQTTMARRWVGEVEWT